MMKFSHAARFACLSALILVGACTTKPEAVNTPPPPVAQVMPPPPPPAPPPPAPVPTGPRPGSVEDFRVNVGDTVHFAYNQYAVQDNDKATLQKQAAWLARYPSVRVTIEGNCDERGTREYNLALGARRANAVKEYLVSLGVSTARIDTISYGKERPICTDSNESCWAQNRRGVTDLTSGANS
jgi:peptidoglycan-associated lipoprotein